MVPLQLPPDGGWGWGCGVPPAPVFDPDQLLGVLPAPGFDPVQLLEACFVHPAVSAAPEMRLVMQRPARSRFMRSLSMVSSLKAEPSFAVSHFNECREPGQENRVLIYTPRSPRPASCPAPRTRRPRSWGALPMRLLPYDTAGSPPPGRCRCTARTRCTARG